MISDQSEHHLPSVYARLGGSYDLQFTSIRNGFLFVVTVIGAPQMQSITVGLNNLAGSYIVEWNMQMAEALITALPTLAVYIFLGHFFTTHGLPAGSSRG